MRVLLINALSFQAAWWLLVLLRGWHCLWIVPLFIWVHIRWVAPAPQFKRDLLPLMPVLAVGIAFDAVLFASGLLGPSAWMPAWLVALWICFVICLPYSLHWLIEHPWPGSVAFAIAGPLSYVAGMALTPVQASEGLIACLVWAVPFWALFVPLVRAVRRGGRALQAEAGR